MDFDRLRAFVWTIEEGTVSRAAERLHRTQPAVTRLLQTLEDQVGTMLIDRNARPLAPTAAGRRMLMVAKQILSLADQLPGLSVHETPPRTSVKLGVARALMWHFTGPAFAVTAAAYADVDFRVRSGWSGHLYYAFCRKELDAAVVLMPPGWVPGLERNAIFVRPEPLVVIAPRRSQSPSAAAPGRNWILNPDGCGFRALVAEELDRRGERLHVRFEIDAAAQDHITLVASGLGTAVVPRSTLRHHPLRSQVREVPFRKMEQAVWLLADEGLDAFESLSTRLAQVFGSTIRSRTRRPRSRRKVA